VRGEEIKRDVEGHERRLSRMITDFRCRVLLFNRRVQGLTDTVTWRHHGVYNSRSLLLLQQYLAAIE
jgi:hypothetical protein